MRISVLIRLLHGVSQENEKNTYVKNMKIDNEINTRAKFEVNPISWNIN